MRGHAQCSITQAAWASCKLLLRYACNTAASHKAAANAPPHTHAQSAGIILHLKPGEQLCKGLNVLSTAACNCPTPMHTRRHCPTPMHTRRHQPSPPALKTAPQGSPPPLHCVSCLPPAGWACMLLPAQPVVQLLPGHRPPALAAAA
jgi:hypothetical protein